MNYSDTSTNISNITVVPESANTILRIAGATSFLILIVLSMTMNGFLMAILIKSNRTYKKSAFYLIVWQNNICDQLAQLIQLIVVVPLTYAGSPIYNLKLVHALCIFDVISYNGMIYFSFLMTLNRFTVFMWPWLNRLLFERPRIYVTIGLLWTTIIIFVGSFNIFGCAEEFSSDGFYYYMVCGEDAYVGQIFYDIQHYASTYLPVVMIAAYVGIYVYIKIYSKSLSTNNDSNKKEYKLLIQCFLICGFLEVQNIGYGVFPALGLNDQWAYVANFIQNWISILNNSINSIVLFIFNSEIQISLKNMLKGTKNTTINSTKSEPRVIRIQSISINATGIPNVRRMSTIIPIE